MDNGNSQAGILSEQEAVEAILKAPETDKPEEEHQAAPDAEVEEEAEELEALEAEDGAVETEGESDDDDDNETPSGDEDTDEDIDADELERGYLRQADYTRKTQEIAAERAQLAQDRQQFTAQAQQQLEKLQEAVSFYAMPTEQEPDWVDLADKLTPQQFTKRQAEWAASQKKRQDAAALHGEIVAQQHEQQRIAETNLLMEKLPEWQDPSIQQRDVQQIVKVAQTLGFSADEVAGITDHRMVLALKELAQAQTAKTVVATKKAKAPKRVKAANAAVRENKVEKERREAAARLRKTGSVDDAVDLLLSG